MDRMLGPLGSENEQMIRRVMVGHVSATRPCSAWVERRMCGDGQELSKRRRIVKKAGEAAWY